MSNNVIDSETIDYAIQNIGTSADIDNLTKLVSKIIMQKHIAKNPIKKYMHLDLSGEVTEQLPTGNREGVDYVVYCCPSCDKCYGSFKTVFCGVCGQKIDWETETN